MKQKPDFATELHATASERGLALADTPQFRFRKKYSLPPTDPRFLDATMADIVLDLWAHAHADDPQLRNTTTDPHFDAELADMEAEASVREAQPAIKVVADEDWEDVVNDHY